MRYSVWCGRSSSAARPRVVASLWPVMTRDDGGLDDRLLPGTSIRRDAGWRQPAGAASGCGSSIRTHFTGHHSPPLAVGSGQDRTTRNSSHQNYFFIWCIFSDYVRSVGHFPELQAHVNDRLPDDS